MFQALPENHMTTFVTASTLARKVDQPLGRILRLVQENRLIPDASAGTSILFNLDRIEDIRAALTRKP